MTLGQRFDQFEIWASGLMAHYGMLFLRFGMGVVFIWFGILKPLGLSPAHQLVLDSTGWIPIPNFVLVLGIWEVTIGICFLFKRFLRVGLVLLFFHMPGTALPFLLCADQCWMKFPYALSLEGQYIVKNLVLIGAALVIGGTLRNKSTGFSRFSVDETGALLETGTWTEVEQGTALVTQGKQPEKVYYIKAGLGDVFVNDTKISQISPGQFVGEMSFLTQSGASATVITTEKTTCLTWTTEQLNELIQTHPHLAEGFYRSFSLDLIQKLRNHGLKH